MWNRSSTDIPLYFEKKERKKIQRIRDNGFSIIVDNGASLMLVGLAAFFRSLLREDPLGRTSVPPPPRYALRLISRGGLRKSSCDNRDFTLGRAIRAGARSSRILSAFFFIYIDLSSSFLLKEGRIRTQWDVWEKGMRLHANLEKMNWLNCGHSMRINRASEL